MLSVLRVSGPNAGKPSRTDDPSAANGLVEGIASDPVGTPNRLWPSLCATSAVNVADAPPRMVRLTLPVARTERCDPVSVRYGRGSIAYGWVVSGCSARSRSLSLIAPFPSA